MRTKSLLKIASLALVLAAPLSSIANAGDHSGDQWRSDDDNRHVATAYAEPNPALVQLEQHVYMADTTRAPRIASFTPTDGGPTTYVKPNPGLAQLEQRTYQNDVTRVQGRTATFTPTDGGPTVYVKANPALVQMEQRSYQADIARGSAKSASVTDPGAAANN